MASAALAQTLVEVAPERVDEWSVELKAAED
jgi:hypothetical protein